MRSPSTDHPGASLAALEQLYRDRLDELCSVAAAILRSREAARDVVQDAFAHAIRQRATFRGDGTLEAWVWRLVVNAARTARRRRNAVPTGDEVVRSNGHAPVDVSGDVADVELAVSLLPERQRVALFLRYYADLDYGTIGEVLGMKPGTVAATLHAAHAALRNSLQEVVNARR
jgi:RNA polymerase sigma-70 factor (ECF subfamily)